MSIEALKRLGHLSRLLVIFPLQRLILIFTNVNIILYSFSGYFYLLGASLYSSSCDWCANVNPSAVFTEVHA